ncbi:E3 ubiquitin-protein ligase siah-1 [Anabrus simplex]|uniref:E3 ubiquitin-protein ligase siah-1 n=1 Tax=Anabrus simplex TaxID=316456 RepID=UPI0035A2AE07
MFRTASKSNFQQLEHYSTQNLLEILKCPYCGEYMTPPIRLCENGHNVCPHCIPKFQLCQTCRGPLLDLRNDTLETLSRGLEAECKFQSLGCGQKFPLETLGKHQDICSYKPHHCPLKKFIPCDWAGQDLRSHLITDHQDRIVNSKLQSVTWDTFNMAYDKNLTQVLLECGEIFLYHRKFNSQTKTFMSAVQYVGLKHHATNFKYDFELYFGTKQQAKMTFVVHSEGEHLEDIYGSGKCVRLSHDIVKQFVEFTNKNVDIKSRIRVSPTRHMLATPGRRISM